MNINIHTSSIIKNVAYAPDTFELAVALSNNRTYIYENVPPNVVTEFSNAQSAGKFFNQNIRDQYEYSEF